MLYFCRRSLALHQMQVRWLQVLICVTGTKVLAYWHKGTNTDTPKAAAAEKLPGVPPELLAHLQTVHSHCPTSGGGKAKALQVSGRTVLKLLVYEALSS